MCQVRCRIKLGSTYAPCLSFYNSHTPYQDILGRQPHLLPSFEGGCHGDLDTKGQNNLARERQIVAASTAEAAAKQRLARGDKCSHVVAMERNEHQ